MPERVGLQNVEQQGTQKAGSTSGDNLSEPLSLAKMVPGDFCGLLILDRWNGVNPSLEVIDDIASPDYGLPKYYNITDTTTDETVRVHHSRVLRFIGDDLPYWESQMEQQ